MDSCIDIYSRLLIATITFVVPILLTLLSTFSEGEKRRKELARKTEEEISKRAAQEMQNKPSAIKETIDKTSTEYKENEKVTKAELNRLNPIVQFWCVFSCLSIALLFLLIDFIIRSNRWGLYSHNLAVLTLAISCIAYLSGLYIIIRAFHTIIKTKKIIDNN